MTEERQKTKLFRVFEVHKAGMGEGLDHIVEVCGIPSEEKGEQGSLTEWTFTDEIIIKALREALGIPIDAEIEWEDEYKGYISDATTDEFILRFTCVALIIRP